MSLILKIYRDFERLNNWGSIMALIWILTHLIIENSKLCSLIKRLSFSTKIKSMVWLATKLQQSITYACPRPTRQSWNINEMEKYLISYLISRSHFWSRNGRKIYEIKEFIGFIGVRLWIRKQMVTRSSDVSKCSIDGLNQPKLKKVRFVSGKWSKLSSKIRPIKPTIIRS